MIAPNTTIQPVTPAWNGRTRNGCRVDVSGPSDETRLMAPVSSNRRPSHPSAEWPREHCPAMPAALVCPQVISFGRPGWLGADRPAPGTGRARPPGRRGAGGGEPDAGRARGSGRGQERPAGLPGRAGPRLPGGAGGGRAVRDGAGLRRPAPVVRADAEPRRTAARSATGRPADRVRAQRRAAAGPLPGRAGRARPAVGSVRAAAAGLHRRRRAVAGPRFGPGAGVRGPAAGRRSGRPGVRGPFARKRPAWPGNGRAPTWPGTDLASTELWATSWPGCPSWP